MDIDYFPSTKLNITGYKASGYGFQITSYELVRVWWLNMITLGLLKVNQAPLPQKYHQHAFQAVFKRRVCMKGAPDEY